MWINFKTGKKRQLTAIISTYLVDAALRPSLVVQPIIYTYLCESFWLLINKTKLTCKSWMGSHHNNCDCSEGQAKSAVF